MEYASDSPEILESLMCPAFTVRDGMIVHANQAASQYQIQEGTPVSAIIRIGQEAYADFRQGKLCLVLDLDGIPHQATVTAAGDAHLFCMESDYAEPELRALALAAQQLREPLANAMASTDMLLPEETDSENSARAQHIMQINRSLHQLLRAVSNMSDAANYAGNQLTRMETRDAVGIFDEVLEKATFMASQADRTIRYKTAKRSALCLVDAEKIERAVWNLVSNAMKFSEKDSIIDAELRLTDKQLIFSIWDSGNQTGKLAPGNMFSRFLRQPGIEDGRSGIGLGLSIVRSVAAAHNGTVLLEQPENSGVKITMAIALQRSDSKKLHSAVRLPIDYAGGRNHGLLELSDSLPCTLYDNNL